MRSPFLVRSLLLFTLVRPPASAHTMLHSQSPINHGAKKRAMAQPPPRRDGAPPHEEKKQLSYWHLYTRCAFLAFQWLRFSF